MSASREVMRENSTLKRRVKDDIASLNFRWVWDNIMSWSSGFLQ